MLPLGIRPTVDFVFKLLFGNPKHGRIAIHFLNAILKHLLKFSKITFLNPIQEPETEDDKLSVFEILATDEHGQTFIVEIQTSLPSGMGQRVTYYTACHPTKCSAKPRVYWKQWPRLRNRNSVTKPA